MLSVQVQLRSLNSLNKSNSCITVKGTRGTSLALSCGLRPDKTSSSGEDVGKTCLRQIRSALCALINTSSRLHAKKESAAHYFARHFLLPHLQVRFREEIK